MPRKRFGVSLPEDLARLLDSLAEKLSVSRSKLVTMALQEFLHEHAHHLYKHYCRGVMVLIGTETMLAKIQKIVEEYRDVVKAYLHVHEGDVCVELLVVGGPSDKISKLHSSLEQLGCTSRFIPLGKLVEASEGNQASP